MKFRIASPGKKIPAARSALRRCTAAVVEQLERRTLLSGGLQVSGVEAMGDADHPFDRLEIAFTRPVQGATLSVEDVQLAGPEGPIAAASVTALAPDRFEIDLSGLTGKQVYTLRVGPDILDESGGALDQDADGTAGEVDEDVYRAVLVGASVSVADGDDTFDQAELLVHGAEVSVGGSHVFSAVYLASGSTLSVAGGTTTSITGSLSLEGASKLIAKGLNTTGPVGGVWAGVGVSIEAGALFVESGSAISADGQGYSGYFGGGGTGPGSGSDVGEWGGSHGGVGGTNRGDVYNTTSAYGDVFVPNTLGSSGGGGFWGAGGSGGGAITLNVSGTLHLDGTISADGQSISGSNGGGGSGGSLFIQAGTLAGSGLFSARGGSNTTHSGGGGAGGRIAVRYVSNDGFAGFAASSTAAGSGSGVAAQGGTSYFLETASIEGHLKVYESLVLPQDTALNFGQITLADGGTLTVGGGSEIQTSRLHLLESSRLVTQGKNTVNQVDGQWAGEGVSILAQDLIVEAGSIISADGQGYSGRNQAAGAGPGGNVEDNLGGSYGGRGGGNASLPYGDLLQPTDLGSAGGFWGGYWVHGSGGNGGGAIRLEVPGTLHLDGEISADGASISADANGGGGSGGSLLVEAGVLAGSGLFTATGGSNPFNKGTGGGGGRIAVSYQQGADFSGFAASTAAPGTGSGSLAEVGTVAFIDQSVPGGHLHVYENLVFPQDSSLDFAAITVAGGTLVVGGGSRVEVSGDLTVTGNSRLILQGRDTYAMVDGVWAGQGVEVNAGSVFVDAGAAITADGQGYSGRNQAAGAGPGGNVEDNVGGAYGGRGGGNASLAYGDALRPTDLGSAGGFWGGYWVHGSGGNGGGAIQLHVGDTLRVDGEVSADGASIATDANGGGGAGGSLFIVAPVITGSGLFSADGGSNAFNRGGGGGGGRIAIHAGQYNATARLQVNGGSGKYAGSGGQATLFVAGQPVIASSLLSATPGTGTQASGSAGVAAAQTSLEFLWVGDAQSYLHGTETLDWMGLCVDPALRLAQIVAVGTNGTYTIASDLPSIGSFDWDTTTVPDGAYELRAIFRSPAGVLGMASRRVLVNNAAQWHSGTIGGNESWAAGDVHFVEGSLTIASGAVLTIEPGAMVKFLPDTGITVQADATLNIAGSEVSPIVLTSILDETVGGLTNPDRTRLAARPGDWRGITLQGNAQLNLNTHVEQRYMVAVHSGTLLASETWASNVIHFIADNVTVPAGLTLAITPGAIVQFGEKKELILAAGSGLQAIGTLAQPIRLTSWRDDSYGDINGDGSATTPAAGDWRWVYVDGAEAVFDHVDLRYGGGTASGAWDGTGVIRTNGAATLSVSNSMVRDAVFDGILPWGGTATIRNTIVTRTDRGITSHPESVVNIINCTIDDNGTGLLPHGGEMNVVNSLITNSQVVGINQTGSVPTVRYSNVWSPGNYWWTRYGGMDDLTGVDGNISVDPLYRNREQDDYQLRYLSPAIDAGDATAASNADFNNAPRHDDPRTLNTGIGNLAGAIPDLGAFEFVEGARSELDLVVTAVNGPALLTAGQSATVTWTVTNRGTSLWQGDWHDALYLQPIAAGGDTTILFVDEVLSTASLRPGDSATFTARVGVPGGTEGMYRWQVYANARGEIFEGQNSSNNRGAAALTSTLAIPELAVGQDLSGEFVSAGQVHYFKLRPAAGADIVLTLDRAGASGLSDIYIRRGQAPSLSTFDLRSARTAGPDAAVAISNARDEWYYVMVAASSLSGGSAGFTLSGRTADYRLLAVGLAQGANAGRVTIPLEGMRFAAGLSAALVGATGLAIPAESVMVTDSLHAYATFNLAGRPLGSYAVKVSLDGVDRSLAGAFQIVSAAAGALETRVLMPTLVRAGREFVAWIEYTNVGHTDLLAPIVSVQSSSGTTLRLEGEESFQSTARFLAISEDGPAGILRPGQTGRIPIYALSVAGDNHLETSITLASTAAGVDLAAMKATLKPATASADWDLAWTEAFPQNAELVGLFAQSATQYAQRRGTRSGDLYELVRYRLHEALWDHWTDASGHVYLGDSLHPIASVDVTLLNKATGHAATARAAADGYVRFLDLQPGTYEVVFSDHLPPEDLQPVTFDGQSITNLAWVLQPGGRVVGKVIGLDDLVIDDPAAVSLVALSAAGPVYTGVIDAEGFFSISHLPAGSYQIQFRGPTIPTFGIDNIVIEPGTTLQLDEVTLVAGGILTGQVRSAATDQPLVGVKVALLNGLTPRLAVTDAEGVFRIEGVPAGEQQIQISSPDYVRKLIIVSVTEGQTDTATVLLDLGAALVGTVTHALQPVANVGVDLYSGSALIAWTQSAADGTYRFEGIAAGAYTVKFDSTYHAPGQSDVNLIAGVEATADIDLQAAALARGTARRSDGALLVGLTLALRQPDDQLLYTSTDASGAFEFPRLGDGQYTLMLPDGSHRQSFTVNGSDEHNLSFTLDLASVEGTVRTAADEPAAEVRVYIAQDDQLVWSGVTSHAGRFAAPMLAPGVYDFFFADGEHSYPGLRDVLLASGSTLSLPEVRPGDATATLALTDAASASPIEAGYLSVTRRDAPSFARTSRLVLIPAGGLVSIAGLAAGAYQLRALVENHASDVYSFTVGPDSTSISLPAWSLAAPASLSGIVTDSLAAPMENVRVVAYRAADPATRWSVRTDTQGQYSFLHLPAGTYTVLAVDDASDASAGMQQVADVSVSAGSPAQQNFTLGSSGFAVAGQIADPSGSSPADAVVELLNADGVLMAVVDADADGHYVFPAVAAGNYILRVQGTGYTSAAANLLFAGVDNQIQDLAVTWAAANSLNARLPEPAPMFVLRAAPSSLASSESWSISGLVNGARAKLRELLGEPQDSIPDLAPLSIPSDCPVAAAWYQKALQLQMRKNDFFQAWHDRWEAAVDIISGDLGKFGFSLLKAALGMYKAATAAPKQLQNLARHREEVLDTMLEGNLNPANLANFKRMLEEVDETYSRAAAILGRWGQVSEGIASGISFTLTIPELFDSFQNISQWTSVDDFWQLANDATSLMNNITSVVSGAMSTASSLSAFGNFPLLDALGQIADILGAVQDGLTGVLDFADTIRELAEKEQYYLEVSVDRDNAYAMALKALEYCDKNKKNDPDGDGVDKEGKRRFPLPKGTTRPGGRGTNRGGGSVDPNDKATIGHGEAGWIVPDTLISYKIRFENLASAELAAQRVLITDPLDSNLDWSTFQLGQVGFNNFILSIPAGLQAYSTRLTLDGNPNPIDVAIWLNPDTGLVTWIFASVDPLTGGVPEDPLAGFLPPNNDLHEGEGFVTFTIRAKSDLASSTVIANQARIVFDENEPIDTNQVLNTIDTHAPQSSARRLNAAIRTKNFRVSWVGADSTTSGVGGYDIYVSVRGKPYQLWLSNTTATSATYAGRSGWSYAFYAVARDQVGNLEAIPTRADATTTIDTQVPTAKLGRLAAVQAKSRTYRFQVIHSDNLLLKSDSVGKGDLLVLGPRKFKQPVTLVSAKPSRGGKTITATYQINAPGGVWDAADAGLYTIWTSAKQVQDTAGNALPRKQLGTFSFKAPVGRARPAASLGERPALRFSAEQARGVFVDRSLPGQAEIGLSLWPKVIAAGQEPSVWSKFFNASVRVREELPDPSAEERQIGTLLQRLH